jgi:ATP-binding cassette subfamily F protein 3
MTVSNTAPRAGGLREQKAQKRLEAETRNALAKVKREKEKHLHELEMKIAALEGQQKELAAALEDPTAYEPGGRATAINRELSSVADDLARLTAEWEKHATHVTTNEHSRGNGISETEHVAIGNRAGRRQRS